MSAAPYADAALAYLAAGWSSPVPLGRAGEAGAKFPVPKGFTGRGAKVPDAEQIERWSSNGYGANNLGLHLVREVGIDVDHYGSKRGRDVLAELEDELGPLPATVRSTARGRENPSGIRLFRLPEGVAELRVTKLPGGVEIIQAKHRYVAAWPSVHPEGGTYEWWAPGRAGERALGRPPKLAALPELPAAWVAYLSGEVAIESAPAAAELSDVEVREWLAEHGAGRPCRAVRGVLRKSLAGLEAAAETGTSRYDTAVEGSWALLCLAVEGHLGVKEAVVEFGRGYREAVREEPNRDRSEWSRMVSMGVAKAAAELAAAAEADEFAGEPHTEGQCPERDERLWPGPSAPLDVARRYVEQCWTADAAVTLRRWRGDFYAWRGDRFATVSEEALRAELGGLLADVEFTGASATASRLRWNPTPQKLAAVLGMLPAVPGVLRADAEEPADGRDGRVALANGVLDLASRELAAHSPERFGLTCLPFGWDESARCPAWRGFLKSVWSDDSEQVALLQEWFGYVVSGATWAQKMLLLVGPTRSGKGVVTRALEALVGREAATSLTLDAFGQNFGLQGAIGRSLIVVPDARFDGRGQAAVVERLLSISGGDSLSIDRKNRDRWDGRLGGRVMVVSNELPMLSEASGALVARFVGPVETTVSWLDAEDVELDAKVAAELAGVLRWALAGYDRLHEHGAFTVPRSARALRREWVDLNAPVTAFVRECCELDEDAEVGKAELYAAYTSWCREHGRRESSDARFTRDLRSAFGRRVQAARERRGEVRAQLYLGVRLRPEHGEIGL